jgi:hypothetical protein
MTSPRTHDTPTVAIVIPLERLTDGERPVVRRRPGRPRRVERAPTVDEQVYLDTVAASITQAIGQDPLVLASSGDDPVRVLDLAIAGVASEAAALRWDRERAVREGRAEADRISSRRVGALLRLADLLLLREQLRQDAGELDPDQVDRVVALLVAEVEAAIREVAPDDVEERFLTVLKAKMASANFPAATGT